MAEVTPAAVASAPAPASRLECFAASRPQDGRACNEDAFLVGRGAPPFVALCDGAGNAERAAKRALGLFEKWIADAAPEQAALPETWAGWIRPLDSALLGGGQSTFVALALVGSSVVGACAGDSRAYRFSRDGACARRLSPAAPPRRREGHGGGRRWPTG